MSQEFFAIDVETANETFDSICAIGIAHFKNKEIYETWESLIDPEEEFSLYNVLIHGITEDDVKGKPKFTDIYYDYLEKLNSIPVVHHTSFDRSSINQACIKYGLPIPNINWLDSAKIVRRSWEQFHYKGYGLENVASFLNIEFRHHNALEDAITAGKIVNAACDFGKCDIDYWIERTKQRIFPRDTASYVNYEFSGNIEGILFGENIVFTGAMQMTRSEAAKYAAELGCNVHSGISKDTTILVVGTQDIRKLKGEDKSAKHRKAEQLIKQGLSIKIISEKDFNNLIGINE